MIIDGLVYGLVSAFILSIFGVDDIFIDSLQPFVHGIKLTSDHFYLAFACLGAIGAILKELVSR